MSDKRQTAEPIEVTNRRALERLALRLLSDDGLEWDYEFGNMVVLKLPPRATIEAGQVVDRTTSVVVNTSSKGRLILQAAGMTWTLTCEESNTVTQLARVLNERQAQYVDELVDRVLEDLAYKADHAVVLDKGEKRDFLPPPMDPAERYRTPSRPPRDREVSEPYSIPSTRSAIIREMPTLRAVIAIIGTLVVAAGIGVLGHWIVVDLLHWL